MTPVPHELALVPLSVAVMEALLAGDLQAASTATGVPLTPYLVDHGWLWRLRLDQVAQDAGSLVWIARAALDPTTGAVVGHTGFHGPPDERGVVEVAYAVDPVWRRRGYGTAMLATALAWARTSPGVTTVRASVSPDNAASLAMLRRAGFALVGEQHDEVDGLELVLERSL